jgi:hypothetical protein
VENQRERYGLFCLVEVCQCSGCRVARLRFGCGSVAMIDVDALLDTYDSRGQSIVTTESPKLHAGHDCSLKMKTNENSVGPGGLLAAGGRL